MKYFYHSLSRVYEIFFSLTFILIFFLLYPNGFVVVVLCIFHLNFMDIFFWSVILLYCRITDAVYIHRAKEDIKNESLYFFLSFSFAQNLFSHYFSLKLFFLTILFCFIFFPFFNNKNRKLYFYTLSIPTLLFPFFLYITFLRNIFAHIFYLSHEKLNFRFEFFLFIFIYLSSSYIFGF